MQFATVKIEVERGDETVKVNVSANVNKENGQFFFHNFQSDIKLTEAERDLAEEALKADVKLYPDFGPDNF